VNADSKGATSGQHLPACSRLALQLPERPPRPISCSKASGEFPRQRPNQGSAVAPGSCFGSKALRQQGRRGWRPWSRARPNPRPWPIGPVFEQETRHVRADRLGAATHPRLALQ